ncbi:3-methylmercaptopropionyl-CoA dehydrogenase (DmdC) [Myxococcus hansupus]|uniref:3-methylmercaptopropionyl-CoA dehydrogenase (DmdC) n=1 Tax=Pseudomyxococcus hansupus TaxID=1297742 RepID=A0A0H4X7V3_9BACT|nr:acyl-CoA dehydrogenase [Myxococcus hansupus]AKQ69655.1 3-methylmercaptopropionyl-CoA dehydrogenase (DmdC) [Myxococcus hansupus]
MSSSNHYVPNLRDIEFNLFEFLDIGSASLGHAPFGDLDETSARQMLQMFAQLSTNELALSFEEPEHNPPKLENGAVTLPPGMKKAMNAFFDAGMHLLEQPPHLGGLGAPPSLGWAAFELLVGANASLAFYTLGNLLARIIDRLGTDAQKQRFLPHMLDRRWGGSMVLTEPDAGSDVGAARTKARRVSDELWEIEGVKRFITNGDSDMSENIIHMVLARPEGAAPGTKGLSLFVVPKYWVNEDGSLGEDNGVVCTKLEKKMGLKGSVTCEMTFGDGKPCRGLLLGEVHDGIRQMFYIIEQARMAVGVKSMATLSAGYGRALAFSKDRLQGADLMQARDKTAPRVPIFRHPDVRRMLMAQKAHAEGMRALCLYTAFIQDGVERKGGHRAIEAGELDTLNDMLLPLVKGYCSEKAYEMLSLSLQVHGGSGYLQDYPVEQYIRDQKIDTLYEGTTHIQALDLLMRKVARDGGATLQGLLSQIRETAERSGEDKELEAERAALGKALGDLETMLGTLMGKLGESVYHVGLQGNRVLAAVAEVVIGWLLVRHAEVALDRMKSNPGDRAFYVGKLASARWFCHEVLPGVAHAARMVEHGNLDLMEVPEESF